MRLLWAATAAAVLAYASPAPAQPPLAAPPAAATPPAATPAAAAPPAAPIQADEDAAKAHFLAGSAYYEQANYADAVKEFNEAHRLSKRPDLLYNISVCYERLGRWDDAIAALKQYLAEKPDAADRAVIESRIHNYEQRRAAEAATPPATPPPIAAPPPTVPPPAHPRHVASLVVGGVGLGLLVAALGTGVSAHLAYTDLQKKCDANMVCNGRDQTLRDEAALGRALGISTDVLIGVGAATLVTGVVLFIVESRRPPVRRAWLAPTGNGLVVRF